jgi:hypothetical protein
VARSHESDAVKIIIESNDNDKHESWFLIDSFADKTFNFVIGILRKGGSSPFPSSFSSPFGFAGAKLKFNLK